MKTSAEISGVSHKFDGGAQMQGRGGRGDVIVKTMFESRLMMATRQVRRPPSIYSPSSSSLFHIRPFLFFSA